MNHSILGEEQCFPELIAISTAGPRYIRGPSWEVEMGGGKKGVEGNEN